MKFKPGKRRAIYTAFMVGISMVRLAVMHNVPYLDIEEVIRAELIRRTKKRKK